VFAGWRTGLSGPSSFFRLGPRQLLRHGLILTFEIIYLHEARGFPTATAGLVLAAVMSTCGGFPRPCRVRCSIVLRAKPILITGNLSERTGVRGLRIRRPSLASLRLCAAVGGAGFGVANTANQVLSLTLVSEEQRASSIALRRVAGNLGLGSGATVADSSSLPTMTSARSRRSTSSTAPRSLSSPWSCSWGSRIPAP
jgi:hypothetical protein